MQRIGQQWTRGLARTHRATDTQTHTKYRIQNKTENNAEHTLQNIHTHIRAVNSVYSAHRERTRCHTLESASLRFNNRMAGDPSQLVRSAM